MQRQKYQQLRHKSLQTNRKNIASNQLKIIDQKKQALKKQNKNKKTSTNIMFL